MPTSEIIVLAVFLLIIAVIYFAEFTLIAVYSYNKFLFKPKPNILLSKPAILIHIFALTGVGCFLYGFFIEPYRVEVNFISIKTEKLEKTSFRIVQISDLHCDKKMRNEKKVVELVNELEPDIIVFTGDAVNRPSGLAFFKDTMKSLKASLAKFAVYGNWEIQHWPGLDYYSNTGFELLEAGTVELTKKGETIYVSGLNCDEPQNFGEVLKDLSGDNYNVFLRHYSDLIEYLEGCNVDLYLCGHTHGGQVALPLYGALITLSKNGKKYESGLYVVNDTVLYVNRGIGLDAFPAPPVRFLARPEIAVFDIGPKH